MKHYNLVTKLLIFLLVAGLISSCGKKAPEYMNVIPQKTTFVFTMDIGSMIKKGKLDNIWESNAYKAFDKQMQGPAKGIQKMVEDIVRKPAQTGIDFTKDMIVFYASPKEKEHYVGILMAMTNGSKLNELLEKVNKNFGGGVKIEKSGDFSYIQIPNKRKYSKNPIFAWNDGALLILTPSFYGEDKDAALKSLAEKLMKQKANESLASNADFSQFIKNKKDLNFWLSSNLLEEIGGREFRQIKQMANFKWEDNFMHSFVDFKKGEINVSFDLNYNDEMKKKLENADIIKKAIDKKLLTYLPQKAFLAVSMAFKPENYYKYMSKMKQFAMVEGQAQKALGMSMKDIFNSFGGDFAYTISNIDIKEVEKRISMPVLKNGKYTFIDTVMMKKSPVVEMTLATTFKNEELYNKLITMASANPNMMEKVGGYYKINGGDMNFYVMLTNGTLIFTSGEDIIKSAEKGGFDASSINKTDIGKNLASAPMYAYANAGIEDYPQAVQDMISDNFNKREFSVFKLFAEKYKSIEYVAKSFNHFEIILKLKSDKENSLYSIWNTVDSNLDTFSKL